METFAEYVNYEDEFELEVKFEFNNGSVLISDIILAKPKGKLLVIAPHWKSFSKNKLTPIDEMKIKVDGVEVQLPGYFYSIPNVKTKTSIEILSNDQTLIGGKNITLKHLKKLMIVIYINFHSLKLLVTYKLLVCCPQIS